MKDVILDSLPRGNSRTYRVEITNAGTPCDLTNWKLFFTMKRDYNDPDDRAVLRKSFDSFLNPEDGIAFVELEPNDTENMEVRKYFYDFKVITEENKEYTLQKGTINIDYTVTRRDVA